MKINFSNYKFSQIVELPKDYEVYDFTQGYDEFRILKSPFGVGKYNEKRKNMYKGDLYVDQRDIHMGIDIGGPVGTPIHSFYEGSIFMKTYNSLQLDYGYTIITEHCFDGVPLYALYGHLSKKSFDQIQVGQTIQSGQVIAWMGDRSENGGWNPHVHFQLSYERPVKCDMPGVVHERDLVASLEKYPDPRKVLGPLYEDTP